MPGSWTAQSPRTARANAPRGVAFRHRGTASAPRMAIISQLNTLACVCPCQRFDCGLTAPTHDSGSGWFAIPFLCDSFIHDSMPVYPGAHHGLLWPRTQNNTK